MNPKTSTISQSGGRFFSIAPILFLLAGFLAAGSGGHAIGLQNGQFEGSLTYNVQADGQIHQFTYFVKDDHARVVMPVEQMGGDMVMLINMRERSIRMVIDQLNAYMEMDIPEAAAEYDMEEGDLTETDETRTIASVECRKYVFTDDAGSVTEIWSPVEQNYGTFMFPDMRDDMQTTPDLSDVNIFPFLIVNEDEGFRMEVTEVSPSTLEDSMFEIPAGYRKMDMPGFGR